jgi:hypothetical protein
LRIPLVTAFSNHPIANFNDNLSRTAQGRPDAAAAVALADTREGAAFAPTSLPVPIITFGISI